MKKAYSALLREALKDIPVVVRAEAQKICLDGSGLNTLSWKGEPCRFNRFAKLRDLKGLEAGDDQATVAADLAPELFVKIFDGLRDWSNEILRENPDYLPFWGQVATIAPTGFHPDQTAASDELLAEVYQDDYIVREKKPFVVDLRRSSGAYLVSDEEKPKVIVDGAAQIATLALGFNDRAKIPMALRSELLDQKVDWKKWDIFQAFTHLFKKESGLPFINIVNSGAEAMETALRACQTQYPKRKKIISFEGSFHGRTLLALHATYNPAKREPFEIFPGQVRFFPFPEQKDPEQPAPEPENWLAGWGKKEANFSADDPLLQKEIEILKQIRTELAKGETLALVIEPMQCEGGDRYGTPRFFRALRELTATHDTPLIFDEVQCLGLGNTFFWHQSFQLQSPPDVVIAAKKAQVGVCLSRFEQDTPIETSAASLYRGYLQAMAIKEAPIRKIEDAVRECLRRLKKFVPVLTFPRNRGICFAFDLPDGKILADFVAARFKHGTIFYPAGEKTARFRLLLSATDREIVHTFMAIYRCFEELAQQKKIPTIPPAKEFLHRLPPALGDLVQENETLTYELPWQREWIPQDKQSFLKTKKSEWVKCFNTLARNVPELIYSPHQISLEELAQVSHDILWEKYQGDESFSKLDLLWAASRAFGHTVTILRDKDHWEQIAHLQELVYEPARQTPVKVFQSNQKGPHARTLMVEADGILVGLMGIGPLSNFPATKFVDADPHLKDRGACCSYDLTVHPEYQGQGLGLRLKVEQMIGAIETGATLIRSRNRYPEGDAMNLLNRALSGVTVSQYDKDYGGQGTSLYQSISLSGSRDPQAFLPALKNKASLGNFVSRSYIHNLIFLREFLPSELRHVYLASGRAEALDKWIKLLRAKRPQATVALSFQEDYFGDTTAGARSLGGQSGPTYFDWPHLEADLSAAEKKLNEIDPNRVLGFFVEPLGERNQQKKSPKMLKELIALCRAKSVPVIFHESGSAFYRYDREHFLAAGSGLEPDGFFMYGGGQLGILGTTKDLFLDKPLMMISTWDGDEHSLNLFRERLLDTVRR